MDPRTSIDRQEKPQSLVQVDPWAAPMAVSQRSVPGWLCVALAWIVGCAPLLLIGAHGPAQRAAVVPLCSAILLALLLTRRTTTRSPANWAISLVTLVVGGIVASSVIGRSSVLVAIAAAMLAARSLEPPPTRWPSVAQRPTVVGLAFGLIVGSSIASVRHPGAPVAAVLLLAVAALVLIVDWLLPSWTYTAHRWVGRVVLSVLVGMGRAALFVGIAICLYLPGAVAAPALRRSRRRRQGSYWEHLGPADRRSGDERRPFVSARASIRVFRLAGAAVLVAVIVVGAVTVLQPEGGTGGSHIRERGEVDSDVMERGRAALEAIENTPYSTRPAYRDMPFADAMQQELVGYTFVPDDVTGYRSSTFEGQYTNVGPNGRATLSSSCIGCPSATVWVVGGSTAFGLGQRDEHTISSELVRLGDAEGISLDVRNLAVPGWTVEQELADLHERLEDPDTDPPDIVVFLDGFNDVAVAVFDEAFGRAEGSTVVLQPEDSIAFLGGGGTAVTTEKSARAGRFTAERYERLRSETAAFLTPRGVVGRHFFQPDAFASELQSAYLDTYYRRTPDLLRRMDLEAALESASDRLAPDVVNLRHLLAGHERPVFGDMVHLNEEGAAIVAAAVWSDIRADVGRAAS